MGKVASFSSRQYLVFSSLPKSTILVYKRCLLCFRLLLKQIFPILCNFFLAAVEQTLPVLRTEQAAVEQTRPGLRTEQAAVEQTRPGLRTEQAAVEQTRPGLQTLQAAVEQTQPSCRLQMLQNRHGQGYTLYRLLQNRHSQAADCGCCRTDTPRASHCTAAVEQARPRLQAVQAAVGRHDCRQTRPVVAPDVVDRHGHRGAQNAGEQTRPVAAQVLQTDTSRDSTGCCRRDTSRCSKGCQRNRHVQVKHWLLQAT